MSLQQEKSFDISVKLTMLDYFRYYYSLFNQKISGRIVNLLSISIMAVYSLSLISLIYIASSQGGINWETVKGILIDLLIIFLFSTPFTRTYLIAYKDAKSHKLLDNEVNVTITEDKFIAYPSGTKLEYSWKKMNGFAEFRHSFALFINKKDLTFVLPKRSFRSKEQIEFMREVVKKYYK